MFKTTITIVVFSSEPFDPQDTQDIANFLEYEGEKGLSSLL